MTTPSIHDTIQLVQTSHAGMEDKQGRPYLRHLLKVVSNLPTGHYGDDYIHVALLHDVVEDTPVTLEDLSSGGYPEHIVNAVDLLTHDKDGTTYHNYVRKIRDSQDHLAIHVKIADNTTNLEDVDKVFPGGWMRERYEKSLRILKGLEQ